MSKLSELPLGFFEKYLAIWVLACMMIGLALSQVFPQLSNAINDLQYSGISIPIGVLLFLMMYPALLNLQFSELKKNGKKPKTNYPHTTFKLDIGASNTCFSCLLFLIRV